MPSTTPGATAPSATLTDERSAAPTVPRAASARAALAARLNWLRAGVLGANDGIISVAGLVIGVAAATSDRSAILTAGVAGLVAGAVSMALGEYVSVSSQRDTERALITAKQQALVADPSGQLAVLAGLYEAKGLSPATAAIVSRELSQRDAFHAHVDAEFGLDAHSLTNPWHAALASSVAFTLGAVLPIIAVLLTTQAARIPATFLAVVAALVVTGSISARMGGAHHIRAVGRLVGGGALAMGVTFAIGAVLGTTVM